MNENTYARFWAKVNKDGPVPAKRPELGPCWLWIPQASNGGYGQFYLNGKPWLAHRASYTLLVEPIPDGLTIDHLCSIRCCIRPEHLEAVSLLENMRRAKVWEGGAAAQRNKTVCRNGHPYDKANTRISPSGRRNCRTCAREKATKRRERIRAENPPTPKPPRETCKHGHSLAEHGVMRDGRLACRECERERLHRSRAKRKAAEGPKQARECCANGHPWTPENVYTDPKGRKFCRACHNARTLAEYHANKTEREPAPKPTRETCRNGHPLTGDEKCRPCARENNRRYEAKIKASRPLLEPRTHCRRGHELTDDNVYIARDGGRRCKACAALKAAEGAKRRSEVGITSPAKSHRQERCKEGHEMTPENTYTAPDGSRKCRECLRRRTREYMRAKRRRQG